MRPPSFTPAQLAAAAALLLALQPLEWIMPRFPDALALALGILLHAAALGLVTTVAAPAWGRMLGFSWAALGLLGNVALLFSGGYEAAFVAQLALLFGLGWLVAVSLERAGVLRALGSAVAALWGLHLLFSLLGVNPYRHGRTDVSELVHLGLHLLVVAWLALLAWKQRAPREEAASPAAV